MKDAAEWFCIGLVLICLIGGFWRFLDAFKDIFETVKHHRAEMKKLHPKEHKR